MYIRIDIGYDCRFSGLTAEDFAGVETTLEDIQQRLLKLFHSDTILLGHSLESDLRSLKVPKPKMRIAMSCIYNIICEHCVSSLA